MTTFKHSAAYSDLLTDEMYVVTADVVRPFLSVPSRVGTWRSPKIVVRAFPSFGWLRVNGQLTDPVTVRIYGDGQLWYTTPPITDREPVRLPPGRYATWEIEVESASRITSVLLASTKEELFPRE